MGNGRTSGDNKGAGGQNRTTGVRVVAIMDRSDGKPWSAMDDDDLRHYRERGMPAEEVAELLCRSGTVEDVKRRAVQLGCPFTH